MNRIGPKNGPFADFLRQAVRAVGGRLLDGFTARYRRTGLRRRVEAADDVAAVATKIVARSRFCLLVTETSTPYPGARVLQPLTDGDFTFRLGTSAASRKVEQLRANPRCLVVFTDHSRGAQVVCECEASVIDDQELRRKTFLRVFRAFWPRGPEDPDFCALRCTTSAIEVWDKRGGVAPDPFGLASARLVRGEDGAWRAVDRQQDA